MLLPKTLLDLAVPKGSSIEPLVVDEAWSTVRWALPFVVLLAACLSILTIGTVGVEEHNLLDDGRVDTHEIVLGLVGTAVLIAVPVLWFFSLLGLKSLLMRAFA